MQDQQRERIKIVGAAKDGLECLLSYRMSPGVPNLDQGLAICWSIFYGGGILHMPDPGTMDTWIFGSNFPQISIMSFRVDTQQTLVQRAQVFCTKQF